MEERWLGRRRPTHTCSLSREARLDKEEARMRQGSADLTSRSGPCLKTGQQRSRS